MKTSRKQKDYLKETSEEKKQICIHQTNICREHERGLAEMQKTKVLCGQTKILEESGRRQTGNIKSEDSRK